VCVIYYNQHRGGIDKKDQLLPVYLVERKRMKKWYMKLFRRLLIAIVFNSLIIYKHNIGHNVDCLKFCIDLVEGFLVKYSVQHKVSSHLHDDNTVKGQTECHFPKNNTFHKKTCKPTRQCSKHDKGRETVYYCLVREVGGCFKGFLTRKSIEIM